MTSDPDDYDRRERRRIADDRRGKQPDERNGATDTADSNGDDPPTRSRRERRTQNGRGRDEHRGGRTRHEGPDRGRDADGPTREAARRNGHRRRSGHADRSRDDGRSPRRASEGEVSVRPGDRNDVSRPRRGGSDHARAQDEVTKADRIARDLGFGTPGSERSRYAGNGRLGDPLDDSEPHRSRQGRTTPEREQRRHSDLDRARLNRLEPSQESSRRGVHRDRNTDTGLDAPEDVGRFEFDTEIRERPRARASELLQESQLEQLLVHETAAADGGLTKPYLSSLPDAYVAERLVFDWLEFLVLNGGYKRTMDALRYYHTVEWLTEDVEAELRDYLVGFSGEVSPTRSYDVEDHHLSLVYIARLASMT